MKVLEGVRVIDFTAAVSGPFATMCLGDLGADVIKIEPPEGELSRSLGSWQRDGKSFTFLGVNRNKKSVTLDLSTPEDNAIAQRLVATADVVVESFGPGGAEKFGLDPTSTRKLNSRLVHCSISGFGRSGPQKNELGTDTMLQAYSGIMSFTGEPGRPPIRIPVASIDLMTGSMALAGVLAALLERDRSGEGQAIEVSLYDTAITLLNAAIPQYSVNGTLPEKWGGDWASGTPNGVFGTADGYIFIAAVSPGHWSKLCEILGAQELIEDDRFKTNPIRLKNREALRAILNPLIANFVTSDLEGKLKALKVPCSRIRNVGDTVTDPHARGRDSIRALPGYPDIEVANMPLKMERGVRELWIDPPTLGNANDEVKGS